MEQELSSIGRMTQNLMDSGIDLGIRILVAIVIYIIGRILISWILKALSKIKSVLRMDETARIYVRNITKAVLYTALFVTIVAELGVPISSMVAILVAAGAAIGLALQGALLFAVLQFAHLLHGIDVPGPGLTERLRFGIGVHEINHSAVRLADRCDKRVSESDFFLHVQHPSLDVTELFVLNRCILLQVLR